MCSFLYCSQKCQTDNTTLFGMKTEYLHPKDIFASTEYDLPYSIKIFFFFLVQGNYAFFRLHHTAMEKNDGFIFQLSGNLQINLHMQNFFFFRCYCYFLQRN